MMEVWKTIPIKGCEHYEISSLGNIRLLPREVPTHIVNRGRDMIVPAKRKGKDIKPSFDGGRPVVRLRLEDGTRLKRSLPLLMLLTFDRDGCPGDPDKYTAAYLDGDASNNKLDNLAWVSKTALMQSVSSTTKGEVHEYLQKYNYILIKVHDKIVGYFQNTTEGQELFNSYGFSTSSSAISRSLNEGTKFFFMFDFVQVSKYDYEQISMRYPQVNLKMLYDIIMEDRRHLRKAVPLATKESKPKVIIKKQIVEKIVYVDKATGQKTSKPRKKKVVEPKEIKQEPLPIKEEPIMEPIQKPEPPKEIIQEVKHKVPVKTRIDDLTDEDFERDMEQARKDKFKDELMRRLQSGR